MKTSTFAVLSCRLLLSPGYPPQISVISVYLVPSPSWPEDLLFQLPSSTLITTRLSCQLAYHAASTDAEDHVRNRLVCPSGLLGSRTTSMAFDMCRKKERTTDLVIQAVKAGFRGIDTACQPKACHPPSLG